MKFIFLLVMLSVQIIIPSDQSDSDGHSNSSPEERSRARSRSAIVVSSPVSPASVSGSSFSDPGSEEVFAPVYLSPLGTSGDSFSGSSSHSDSECEKWAMSDRELLNIGRLYQLISNKLYGSPDFQKNVYSALDLNRHLSFNPIEGKTLGDLQRCLFEHQKKIDVHIREHIFALERVVEENGRTKIILQQMQNEVAALQNQLSDQQILIHEQRKFVEQVCGIVKDTQNHVLSCQQEMRTLASLMAIMHENYVVQTDDKSERQ